MSTICEFIVHPEFAPADLARELLRLAYEQAPSGIVVSTQPASDDLMRSLGWQRGPRTYFKRKEMAPGAAKS
jgi:hypothetical protein